MKKYNKKRLYGLLFAVIFITLGIFIQRVEGGEEYFEKLRIAKASRDINAPDFTIKDINGKEISLKDLKGKVILLNFFATW